MIKSKQAGFTLVELIIVIVILGILAATALPRFASFTSDAQKAARSGVLGGLNSAVGVVHAKWLSSGSSGASVTLDGGLTVTVDANGYPDVTGTYKTTALCQTLVNLILATGTTGAVNPPGLAITSTPPACIIDGATTWAPAAATISLINTGAS